MALSRLKTWITGEKLKATDLNAEFNNITTNFSPTGMDDISSSVANMQTTVNPGGVGSESLSTTLAGELHRLRFMVKAILGAAQWYVAPTRNLSTDSLAVDTGDIVNDAVTNDKIADDAVDTDQLIDSSVTNDKMADDAVDTAELVDGAVTTDKLDDGAVTQAKLASVNFVSSTSSGTFTVTNNTETDITNLSLSFTTTGRPIVIQMIAGTSAGGSGYISTSTTGGATFSGGTIYLYSGATTLCKVDLKSFDDEVGVAHGIMIPPSAVQWVGTLAAGTSTIKATAVCSAASGNVVAVNNVLLIAYEL